MNDLEKVKYVDLLLLHEIDRICQKYHIPYFLYAGTLLGAVREQNFISWDDDADIGFLRKDYETFLKIAPSEISGPYELILPNQTGGFYDLIAKLTYKDSRLHSHKPEDDFYNDKCSRISLDIYIIDNTFSNRALFQMQCFALKSLYGMMIGKRFQISWDKYSLSERIQVKILSTLGKPFSLTVLMRWYDYISQIHGQTPSPYVFTSNSIVQKLSVRYQYEWFIRTVPSALGTHIFQIPEGYESVLKARYGDYMTPQRESFSIQHATKNEVEVLIDGNIL